MKNIGISYLKYANTMLNFISKRLTYFGPALGLIKKREALLFSVLTVTLGLSEALGFSMLLPILKYVEDGQLAFNPYELPMFIRWILSAVSGLGLQITFFNLLILAFIPMLLRQVLNFARVVYIASVLERITARLRDEGFRSFINADIEFHAQERQGALLSALTIEAHRAGSVAAGVMSLVATLFMIGLYVTVMLAISPIMTLIALATAGVASLLVGRVILPISRRTGEEVSKSYDTLYGSFMEELSAIRLIKMRSQEQNVLTKVSSYTDYARHTRLKGQVLQGGVRLATEPIFLVGIFGMVFLGVELIGVSLATLGVLMVMLLRAMPLANELNSSRQTIALELASLLVVKQHICAADQSHKIKNGDVNFDGLKKEIEFDHVSFSYHDGHGPWALNDVSFNIPRGSMTALVGRSGAGKSTLVDLLPRLRDATKGVVRIDGIPVTDFNLDTLRNEVGYLSQETFLFNGTIFDNISYGTSATPGQVEAAAKRAYAHDFITASHKGYESEVGDRGVRLSVGQRQRVGIARIMLQNPDIIILDEPTSALDSESEHFISMGLDEIRAEKTIIVIAHRLSTIRQADQIIVLDEGRLTERGDHQVLLDQHGGYSRLFDLQINV